MNVLAVCDVDKKHLENGNGGQEKSAASRPICTKTTARFWIERYRCGQITTPDHWHSKIAIEAMQAGKDVYCERTLTLTIQEGKKICQVQKQTSACFKWARQRDEIHGPHSCDRNTPGKTLQATFLQAVALCRRETGKVKNVTCSIRANAPPVREFRRSKYHPN